MVDVCHVLNVNDDHSTLKRGTVALFQRLVFVQQFPFRDFNKGSSAGLSLTLLNTKT
jgi:hypothetical protein